MRRPPTQYVSVGKERVAYQVFGEGDAALLFLKSTFSSIDAFWEHPGHLRVWRFCRAALRIVMLDHRGTGVSDPVEEHRVGDLDERMEDVLAVLDHLGIDQACVQGEAEQAIAAVKLALDHPDRVAKLILLNAVTEPVLLDEDALEGVRRRWGTGKVMPMLAPFLGGDPEFAARFERLGVRPSVAVALMRSLADLDLSALLPRVRVPTLVMHTGDIAPSSIEDARDLAEHIDGAQLFDAPATSFYWGGGAMEAIVAFASDSPSVAADRDLASILFTDIVGSTEAAVAARDDEWRKTLDFLDDLVANRVETHRGRVVKQTGDGHLLEFARPGDAVRAALAIVASSHVLGVTVRAGVHTGEIERREGGDVGGLTVHVAARVAGAAGADEVLVSRTVVDLIGGAEFDLTDRGDHTLKGVPGTWRLFGVTE